jgi:hypothetical protein
MRPTSDDGKSRLVTGITEGKSSSSLDTEVGNVLLGDIESDRHGEEEPLGLAVGLDQAESITNTEEISSAQTVVYSSVPLTKCSLPRS